MVVLAAALVLAAFPVSAAAHVDEPIQPDALVMHDCHEFFAFPTVPYEEAQQLVPDRYRDSVMRDAFNPAIAKLFIATRRCERLEVGGSSAQDTIDAYITVPIEQPADDPPHDSGIAPADSDLSPIELELYIVEWVTNTPAHATWLKRGTGLGEKVRVVTNLVYDYGPSPAGVPGAVDESFAVAVPRPARSPFVIEARVTEPGPAPWDAAVNMWAETTAGTVIIFVEHPAGPDQHFGPAAGTILAEDPHSPLGKAFGDQSSRPTSADADKGITADPFSSGSFTVGQWTKCVLTVSRPCSTDDHQH